MSRMEEKLRKLDQIEKNIRHTLVCASLVFTDLSKDKPNMETVARNAIHFLDTLKTVDSEIGKQIAYLGRVSTASQPHEGSSYDSQKALDMARHRLEHMKSKLSELEALKMAQNVKNHENTN